jgi:GT2 family glycosyltransferase
VTALVTVVIVNWNGARLLPDCLDALAKQDLDGKFEVWMVDNASADDSVELVERDYPWVRVLRNGSNDGFAGGNNVALREVGTPYVALCNSDARPSADWLRNLLAPFEAPGQERLGATTSKILFLPRFLPLSLQTGEFVPGGLDSRTLGVRVHQVMVDGNDVTEEVLWDRVAYGPEGSGASRFRWTMANGELFIPVDGHDRATVTLTMKLAADRAKPVRLRWPGGSVELAAGTEPAEVSAELPLLPAEAGVSSVDVINSAGSVVFTDGYGGDRAYQELDQGQFDRPEEVFAVCGAACAFRTEALAEAGLFDDDFFLYYEDTDLSWRLQRLGWRIRYEPAAVVRHIHAASSTEWSPLFTFHVDRNRLLMLAKNARPGLAAREAARYPLTTASLALRQVAQARHTRRRPPVRPTVLRLRVTASYLRLLGPVLARRLDLARREQVGAGRLERWFIVR